MRCNEFITYSKKIKTCISLNNKPIEIMSRDVSVMLTIHVDSVDHNLEN
jgi:hypothetical protein